MKRTYCPNAVCTWYRDARTGPGAKERFLHPQYGWVTYEDAAIKDIGFHNCFSHARVQAKLEAAKATHPAWKKTKENAYA